MLDIASAALGLHAARHQQKSRRRSPPRRGFETSREASHLKIQNAEKKSSLMIYFYK
jgi:hypothetical protein